MTKTRIALIPVSMFLLISAGSALCQVATSSAGLTNLGVISVPNWTAAGPNQQATDLSSFNPVTQVLYYADRVNHAVLAIDTKTNSVLGFVPVPKCTGSCPSGVLVVPDLQKLVVTDRATTVYTYDLDLPGSPPAAVIVPTAIDELDYDPIHQRVYIGNSTAPFFLTGIDLVGDRANTVVASIPLPASAEQPRFNPVDGLTYLTIPSVGVLVFDPNGGPAGTGSLMATWPISNCSGNGNWIDPVTNTMLVGCNNVGGQALVSMVDGSVLTRFPQATTDDVMAFNSGNRRLVLRFWQQRQQWRELPGHERGKRLPDRGRFPSAAGDERGQGDPGGRTVLGPQRIEPGSGPDPQQYLHSCAAVSSGSLKP